jgi:hypothetical protein
MSTSQLFQGLENHSEAVEGDEADYDSLISLLSLMLKLHLLIWDLWLMHQGVTHC